MRKRSLYFAAALLTIILVLIFNTANIANAGIRETERYKYFTSIEVEAGTSLWDIAEEYMKDVIGKKWLIQADSQTSSKIVERS